MEFTLRTTSRGCTCTNKHRHASSRFKGPLLNPTNQRTGKSIVIKINRPITLTAGNYTLKNIDLIQNLTNTSNSTEREGGVEGVRARERGEGWGESTGARL